jgi:hypothetical protein
MLPLLAPLAALPWLTGFFAPEAASDHGRRDVISELSEYREPAEDCIANTYGGLTITADVAATPGAERVVASYGQGVFVFDRERRLLAQSPALTCQGSADELVAIAAGDGAIGVPIVAMAATSGGRAESTTWLTLFRVSDAGELQPVFIGEVENHANQTTHTGTVTLIPGGLIYRDPDGAVSLFVYDHTLGRYIEQLTTRPYA